MGEWTDNNGDIVIVDGGKKILYLRNFSRYKKAKQNYRQEDSFDQSSISKFLSDIRYLAGECIHIFHYLETQIIGTFYHLFFRRFFCEPLFI